jgi:hypothetical protein
VLEPQPWRSYKAATHKRSTLDNSFRELSSLQLRPDDFTAILTQVSEGCSRRVGSGVAGWTGVPEAVADLEPGGLACGGGISLLYPLFASAQASMTLHDRELACDASYVIVLKMHILTLNVVYLPTGAWFHLPV